MRIFYKVICFFIGHKGRLKGTRTEELPKGYKAQLKSSIAISKRGYMHLRGNKHWPENCKRCGTKVVVFAVK